MTDTDPIPNNEHLPSYSPRLPEAQMIQNLIDSGTDGPKIGFSFLRHNSYDFHKDGKLTPDELYLIPASPGNDELGGVVVYSLHSDDVVAAVLSHLPDNKIARTLTRGFIKPRKVFENIARDNSERTAHILLGMRENPYNNSPYSAEGFRAYMQLKTLPHELQEDILQHISTINPQYEKNIRRQASDEKTLTPNKADYPWSSELVESSRTGELPRYQGQFEAKKIFQGQFSVAKKGENLQTFGVNDCVAIAFIDKDGNKALVHMDVGMDYLTSLDHILYMYVKNGGDLADTKVAALGGYDMSREMIWAMRERLQQAGLQFDVTRLLSGDSKQLLVTDDGFFDFEPDYTPDDKTNMQAVLDRIAKEGNGRVATMV